MSETTSPPPAKRTKTTQQSSLTSFFGAAPKKDTGSATTATTKAASPKKDDKHHTGNKEGSLGPIVPQVVPIKGKWGVCQSGAVLYRLDKQKTKPVRSKIAGFDLSGTLLDSIKQYPNALTDYELWNTNVLEKLRHLHDHEQCNLVLFLNQGKIKGALTGKTATTTKTLIEWLIQKINRPVAAFVSTNTKSGFHKPSCNLWTTAQDVLGTTFDIASSLFVGDSVDHEDGPGADQEFARNVGALTNDKQVTTLAFYTPNDYFGPSYKEQRSELQAAQQQLAYDEPPASALHTRAALMGSRLGGPILMVLCGPQGSGKSYFGNLVTQNTPHWAVFSQDTIRNGQAGTREAVETAVKAALNDGLNVIVDRMHLDQTQRAFFVTIGQTVGRPVHAVVLKTAKKVVSDRVLHRENHKVSGKEGAKMAQASWNTLQMPKYEEGFALISATATPEGVQTLTDLYRSVDSPSLDPSGPSMTVKDVFDCQPDLSVPSIALGTFRLGKRIATDTIATALKLGFSAFDTAPTYNNEDLVGSAMAKDSFCIVKVPKRATTAVQVHEELDASLEKLKRNQVDLLLLHWPCDVIASNTLEEVWEAMEECVKDGKAKALGVCNFNVGALRLLLKICSTCKPVVNQVERHPLLPQWDLVDFCAQHDILLQAHSSLGQGSADLLEHEVIQNVSTSSGLSAAQVVLQWNILQSVAVVVKCSSENHMTEVLGARGGKTLSPDHLKALDEIFDAKRFVAPPFMYGNEFYQWKKG